MTELLARELLEDPLNALMLIGSRARADHSNSSKRNSKLSIPQTYQNELTPCKIS